MSGVHARKMVGQKRRRPGDDLPQAVLDGHDANAATLLFEMLPVAVFEREATTLVHAIEYARGLTTPQRLRIEATDRRARATARQRNVGRSSSRSRHTDGSG